jgi:hypothetical protein
MGRKESDRMARGGIVVDSDEETEGEPIGPMRCGSSLVTNRRFVAPEISERAAWSRLG